MTRRFFVEPIQDYIPVTRAKAALLDLIRQIEHSDETIAITKNGVPEAVLMSMRKFRGLLETLEILSDEKAMKSIRKSITQTQKGKWIDVREVLGE
jgi:prevent-host-death family protein